MTGHCLGNAGALEALVCVKAIQDSYIPATINLDEVDVEGGCDLDYRSENVVDQKSRGGCAVRRNEERGGALACAGGRRKARPLLPEDAALQERPSGLSFSKWGPCRKKPGRVAASLP